MARAKIKTEMTGTGGGRWCKRADAKADADGRRREAGKAAALTGYQEYLTLPEWRVACHRRDHSASSASGYYVRAADRIEAVMKASRMGMRRRASDSKVTVERWKEPGE